MMLQLDPASLPGHDDAGVTALNDVDHADGRYRGLRFAGVSARERLYAVTPRRRSRPVASRRATAPPERDAVSPEQTAFLHHVFGLAALPLPRYRVQPLARRLPACLRALKAGSLSEATRQVTRNPDALSRAIDALVIGVTSFFRDPPVFAHLESVIIPALVSRQRPLRVWSAACSDGAELYSVGMLLLKHGAAIRTLHGTDIRLSAIDLARRACYGLHQVASIDPEMRQRFFTQPKAATFEIIPTLRALARWDVADLLQAPFQRDEHAPDEQATAAWDLILCRNMSIYLNEPAATRLWFSLAGALRSGGYLVVGKAERPPVSGLRRVGHCFYQKR